VLDPSLMLTGWLERREREALVYLIEEDRLLRRQWGGRRLWLSGGNQATIKRCREDRREDS
jgi:hypothetical protein